MCKSLLLRAKPQRASSPSSWHSTNSSTFTSHIKIIKGCYSSIYYVRSHCVTLSMSYITRTPQAGVVAGDIYEFIWFTSVLRN